MTQERTRRITLTAGFIALGVAVGYPLASVPVELISATMFIAGFVLGSWNGALVGMMTMFFYSSLSPFGMAAPPVLFAQMVGMALAGAAGALVRRRDFSRVCWQNAGLLAVLGGAVTLVFDVLTTLASTLIVAVDFRAMLLMGAFFYLTHLISNGLIFGGILPLLFRELSRHPLAARYMHFDQKEQTG